MSAVLSTPTVLPLQPFQRLVHIVGPQGSGKGRLARIIRNYYQAKHRDRPAVLDVWEADSIDMLVAGITQHPRAPVLIAQWLREPPVPTRPQDLVLRLPAVGMRDQVPTAYLNQRAAFAMRHLDGGRP